MALDMDRDAGSSTWFGFSPALVVGLAVLAIGGGALATASGGDGYESSIRELCVDSEKQVYAHSVSTNQEARDTPEGLSDGNIFTDFRSSVDFRIAGLAKIEPDAGHAELHRQLLASEQSVASMAGAGAAKVRATGRPYGTLIEDVQAILAVMQASDALYVEAGAPKGCGD